MKYAWIWCMTILLLPGCNTLPFRQDGWGQYMARVDRMNPDQLQMERAALLHKYQSRPDDQVRLRLSYVLSRDEPSLPRLKRARRILAEVDTHGDSATIRNLLDRQLALSMSLQKAQGQILQLKTQLEKLKKIETDLSRPADGEKDDGQ